MQFCKIKMAVSRCRIFTGIAGYPIVLAVIVLLSPAVFFA
jgi:hypothetical protein